MNLRATNLDMQSDFSETVDHFIKRYCRRGTGLNISDKALFQEFRAFWITKASETQHPALLGQFCVHLHNLASILPLEQICNHCRPARLMAGADTTPSVTMEVLVEWDMVTPVRIVLEGRVGAKYGPVTLLIA